MEFKIIGLGLLLFISSTKSEAPSNPQTSARLCSENASSAGVYRFHDATQSCYKVGEQGPCGERMIFYAHPENEDTGDCDCDLKFRCHRPLMYWAAQSRCYLAYERGPCQINEWLVFDKYIATPKCEANPCAVNETEFDDEVLEEFWFEKDDQCYRTNSQAFCDYSNEIAMFNGFSEKVKPKCSVVEYKCSLPEIPSLFCATGQKWLLTGGCHQPSDCNKHNHHHHRRHHHSHHSPRFYHNHNHGFPYNQPRRASWRGPGRNYKRWHGNQDESAASEHDNLNFDNDAESTISESIGRGTRRRSGRIPKKGTGWPDRRWRQNEYVDTSADTDTIY